MKRVYKQEIRPEARAQSGGTGVVENKGIGQLNRRDGVTRVGRVWIHGPGCGHSSGGSSVFGRQQPRGARNLAAFSTLRYDASPRQT
jgi:hypothetical protein